MFSLSCCQRWNIGKVALSLLNKGSRDLDKKDEKMRGRTIILDYDLFFEGSLEFASQNLPLFTFVTALTNRSWKKIPKDVFYFIYLLIGWRNTFGEILSKLQNVKGIIVYLHSPINPIHCIFWSLMRHRKGNSFLLFASLRLELLE